MLPSPGGPAVPEPGAHSPRPGREPVGRLHHLCAEQSIRLVCDLVPQDTEHREGNQERSRRKKLGCGSNRGGAGSQSRGQATVSREQVGRKQSEGQWRAWASPSGLSVRTAEMKSHTVGTAEEKQMHGEHVPLGPACKQPGKPDHTNEWQVVVKLQSVHRATGTGGLSSGPGANRKIRHRPQLLGLKRQGQLSYSRARRPRSPPQ